MPLLFTYIDIGSSAVSSTMAYAGGIVSDFQPIWLLILGVFLGAVLIEVVAGLLRHKS
jgi:hypothetical protein